MKGNDKVISDGESGFEFDRRLVVKQGDLITVNTGTDPSTAQVSHLRINRGRDHLYRLDSDQVARLFGSPKLVRSNLFGDRDKGVMQKQETEPVPSWFRSVTGALPFDLDEFVVELDHLQLDMFFAREIVGGAGTEWFFQLVDAGPEGSLDVETLALLNIPGPDETLEAPEALETGEIVVEVNRIERGEDGGVEYDIDVDYEAPETLSGEARSALREVLTGICLKHGYTEEPVVFMVEEFTDSVKAWFPDKGFTLLVSLDAGVIGVDVPVWARALLVEDGAPVPLEEE